MAILKFSFEIAYLYGTGAYAGNSCLCLLLCFPVHSLLVNGKTWNNYATVLNKDIDDSSTRWDCGDWG